MAIPDFVFTRMMVVKHKAEAQKILDKNPT